MAKMTNNEYANLLMNDPHKQKVLKSEQARLKQKSIREEQELHGFNPMSIVIENEKLKRKNAQYKRDLKESLLFETLNMILSKAIPESVVTEDTSSMVKNILSTFIKEEGGDRLLNSFSTKTLFLSEVNRNINDILTGESIPEDKSDDFKANFKSKIIGTELDDIIDTIRKRVSNSLDEFITNNTKDKLKIKEILTKTQEKVDKAKSESLKESAQRQAKKQIRDIRSNRTQNILEYMIYKSSKTVITNEDLKPIFTNESGNINIDKVVENCVVSYAFLEMLNTMKIKNVNEKYISDFIGL